MDLTGFKTRPSYPILPPYTTKLALFCIQQPRKVTPLPLTHLVRLPPIQSPRHELKVPDPVLESVGLGHGNDVIHLSDLARIRPACDVGSTSSTKLG